LISVGRLTEAKDHPNLLAAVDLLRQGGEPVELVIVGEGELRPSLEAEIARRNLGTAVTLAGVRTDPEHLLREADVFVLSSSREGFPVVVLEAMASGLPVVSTRVGGVSEILQDGENGMLVPPGDPGALAAAIRRLMTDSTLRASLGRRARETVASRFSLDRAVERYGRLYETALARRRS
jgi:glycosyltransferase involved in cell wall biosynthesis